MVINFWATWCPPCREETPLFVELQEKYREHGVRFIGVAIDDPEPTQDFVDTYGVNYPVLIGDSSAIELSRRLGNRFQGLPFTVVARPDGRIASRVTGEVERDALEPLLLQLSR
jgi:thiol-disulfide isomerase/thioredoxin